MKNKCSRDAHTASYMEAFFFFFPLIPIILFIMNLPRLFKVGGRPSDYLESEISYTLHLTSQEYLDLISLSADL